MNELFDWLARLSEFENGKPPEGLAETMKRLSSPSPVSMGGIIRVVDPSTRVHSFGRLPAHLGVLSWVDDRGSGGPTLEDQALAAQIGAILTLSANRRMEVAASDLALTMEGTSTRTFLPTSHIVDASLTGPLPDDMNDRFGNLVRNLWGLAAPDREPIGAAIELHYAATLLFDVDPNASYALCVAGIERLSRSYGSPLADWASWEDSERLDRVFDGLALTGKQADRIRSELLKNRHLRLRQTFAGYVASTLPKSFWDAQVEQFVPGIRMEPDGQSSFQEMLPAAPIPVERFVPRDHQLLRTRLLASYDARSSYVHEGKARAMTTTTMGEILETEAERRQPIGFAGLRHILMRLIFHEIESRGELKDLPSVQLTSPIVDSD